MGYHGVGLQHKMQLLEVGRPACLQPERPLFPITVSHYQTSQMLVSGLIGFRDPGFRDPGFRLRDCGFRLTGLRNLNLGEPIFRTHQFFEIENATVLFVVLETGVLLPNNQRQHRPSHTPKDVLPSRMCARYCAPSQLLLRAFP